MGMFLYSSLLALGLVLASPWWLWRMATTGRYRAGLSQRLGIFPRSLRAAVGGRRTVWVHAVSVGEVLAVQRLIAELRAALPEYAIAVSTTTATGQAIAREKLVEIPVFFFPLDFAFAVRHYLRALQPALVVTVESELWPRLIVECDRKRIPLAVVNARVSDRSFPRYMRLRWLWRPLLAKVSLFLAQGEESAQRLREIGALPERVKIAGNLKYDFTSSTEANKVVERMRELLAGRPLVVAGSTLPGEELMVLRAWRSVLVQHPEVVLVIAPRHPQWFGEVEALLLEEVQQQWIVVTSGEFQRQQQIEGGAVFLLDTLGDLASVYELASVAFIGGSLVPKGGHNPLEAARFGVPVVMGPSFENFREMVDGMQRADAISIVRQEALAATLISLLRDDAGMGNRGRLFFEQQSGATGKTVSALVGLLGGRE